MLGIFITAGHPSIEKSVEALQILDQEGVDLIELGVPFSDPMADGPVIQESSHKALENGVNLDKVFEIIKEAKNGGVKKENKGLDNLILFSYYNPLFAYGFDKLISKCKEHGVKGALIPDLPMDEAEELCAKFKENGLCITLLAAPTSTKERAKKICELSSPFVYLVSRTGITGGSEDLSTNTDLKKLIKELKTYTKNPIGLGFGIDSKEKAEQAIKLGADMAIIGSKTVKLLDKDISEFKSFVETCMKN